MSGGIGSRCYLLRPAPRDAVPRRTTSLVCSCVVRCGRRMLRGQMSRNQLRALAALAALSAVVLIALPVLGVDPSPSPSAEVADPSSAPSAEAPSAEPPASEAPASVEPAPAASAEPEPAESEEPAAE